MNTSKSDKGKKKNATKEKTDGGSCDIRFMYMNVRNKSYVVRPSKKTYALQTSTSFNVGPGKYNPKVHQNSTSFEFSKAPRFGNDKIGFILNRILSKSKMVKNSSDNKLVKKDRKITVRAKKMKADIVKITKLHIKSSEKEEKSEKFREKFKKAEYRKRITELAVIKKSWISLFSTFGVAHSISSYLKNRRNLRNRTRLNIGRFSRIVQIIGKIQIKLRKFRKTKAIKNLRIFFLPHLKKWLVKRKNRYKSLILTMFEKTLASSTLFSVSIKYHELLIRIQRSLRFALSIRRLLYDKLFSIWTETEKLHFQKQHRHKKHVKSSPKHKKKEGNFLIPDEIKRFFLLELIKDKISGYLQLAKNYTKSCKAVDELNRVRDFEIKVMKHEKIQYPQRPKKVMLLGVIGKEDLKQVIFKAERCRATWNEILSGISSKIGKSIKIK